MFLARELLEGLENKQVLLVKSTEDQYLSPNKRLISNG